jgi:hypothetical protein
MNAPTMNESSKHMNRGFFLPGIGVLVLLGMMFASGCKKDSDTKPKDDLQLRQPYEVLLEANAVKQAAMYDVIKAFSNDYQDKFLSRDLTYEQIDAVFDGFARAAAFEEEVEKALLLIDKANKDSELYRRYPAAAEVRGIGDAMRQFYGWASGSSKRSRNRILTVASNLSEADRTRLFNGLRPHWKNQAGSEADFWKNLEQGKFDNAASQMYNDFYHNAETDFADLAIERGLSIQKIVVKEGAEGIEKGAGVIIETTKLVHPGLGQGIDMVEKGIEYVEKAEKIFTDPAGALVDEIKDQVAGKIGGFVDIDGVIDATGIGEELGEAMKVMLDAALGSDDPAEWVKTAIDWGAAKFIDEDKPGNKMDIIVAELQNAATNKKPQVIIGVTTDQSDDSSIDLVLPPGEWSVTAVDIQGNVDRLITQVISGVMSIILANTDPAAQVSDKSYSLSAWVSPANPAANQSVYAYAQVFPKDAGVEVYFEIAGTDGYSNSETKVTDTSGLASFRIPGGATGVKDVVTIRLVKTGATRTLSYSFY